MTHSVVREHIQLPQAAGTRILPRRLPLRLRILLVPENTLLSWLSNWTPKMTPCFTSHPFKSIVHVRMVPPQSLLLWRLC